MTSPTSPQPVVQPSPADELRAAAEIIRERATDAFHISPLPWTIDHGVECGAGVIRAAGQDIIVDRSCDLPGEAIDLPWIALMHPGLGEPIAQWLERQASTWSTSVPVHDTCTPATCTATAALAVARALLGDDR